jgi:uncharacterized lipoprotein YmbA
VTVHISGCWLLAAGIWLVGCGGSPPVQYYTLSAEASPDPALALRTDRHIAIGPITVPNVVDRPQLVMRTTANRVTLLEEHQWAEPLPNEIARVIADNLSRLLGTKLISLYPHTAADHAPYRVLVDVQQFESTLGSRILLDASWTVRHSDHGDTSLKIGRSNVEEPAHGPGYEAVAAAHSRALVRISRDIAESIRAMNTAR